MLRNPTGIVRRLIPLLILAVTSTRCAEDETRAVDTLLTSYHDAGLFNGSALVSRNGHVIFKRGFGFADLEWKVPNAPDTKFRIGSITKQFTATLVMQLVDERKLSLDATRCSDLSQEWGDTEIRYRTGE